MLTELTKQQKQVVSDNDGLHRYLESLLVGRKATPRSWLYEQISPEEVLKNWKERLATLEKGGPAEQEVYQFDLRQEAKWGPQGEVAPISELMEIVMQGFGESPTPKLFSMPFWTAAKRRLSSDLATAGVRNLRPATYKSVVDDMRARDTLESNSGWPLFSRRNKPEVIAQSIADAESGKWKEYPAIALFRNYNLKTRLVWMFPMSANIVEGSYFQVLQSAMVKRGFRFLAPWVGFEAVRRMVSTAYNDLGWVLAASDFSQTDAHFHLSASMEVYEVLAPLFQPQFRAGLKESLEHMHTIPLVIGPEAAVTGSHGVSSGSNWTNFIETIFDWILSYYVFIDSNERDQTMPDSAKTFAFQKVLRTPLTDCYVPNSLAGQGYYAIGDDMTWVFGRRNSVFPEYLERVGKSAGMEINADKVTNERDVLISLQRLFLRGYNRPDGLTRAVYPTIRALKSSVYPERFHDPRKWSSDMFCARQFMILENCVDHPLFEEFVEFVCRGQRDLIPFAKQSRARLDEILRASKLLPGLNPTYNQERRDYSFADFESVKVASKL